MAEWATVARPPSNTNLGLNKLYSNESVQNSCMGSLCSYMGNVNEHIGGNKDFTFAFTHPKMCSLSSSNRTTLNPPWMWVTFTLRYSFWRNTTILNPASYVDLAQTFRIAVVFEALRQIPHGLPKEKGRELENNPHNSTPSFRRHSCKWCKVREVYKRGPHFHSRLTRPPFTNLALLTCLWQSVYGVNAKSGHKHRELAVVTVEFYLGKNGLPKGHLLRVLGNISHISGESEVSSGVAPVDSTNSACSKFWRTTANRQHGCEPNRSRGMRLEEYIFMTHNYSVPESKTSVVPSQSAFMWSWAITHICCFGLVFYLSVDFGFTPLHCTCADLWINQTALLPSISRLICPEALRL